MLANQRGKVVFANDFNTSNAEQKEEFQRYLFSHYQDADAIENSASCDCEHITEAYKLGVICDNCGTPVVSTSNRPIVPSMWIRAPEGVDRLVSPELWIMLSGYMSMKEFDFLEYLTNTQYQYDYDTISSKETKRKLDKLLARQFPRGLNNFVQNFDTIFQFLLDSSIINTNKGEMAAFVNQNKEHLFPKNIPIPTKLCFVVESTTSGVYIDKPIGAAIDAVLTISSIGSSAIPLKPITVQNRVARALKLLAIFHENYDKQRIAQKPGLVRRHVLGGRLNLTARAVITSISDPHDYDELHIPWGVGCQLLKYHLINKLKRKFRMTTRQANSFIYENVLKYNEVIDQLFKEIIAESKYKGLPCVFHRNPTLQRGSTQQFFITVIKNDIRDNSISMSVLCLKAPNADFDGDQLNLTLMPDNYLADATERIAPHTWVLSPDDPHEISGNLELQGPVVETIINYAHEDYLPSLEEWLAKAA
ncbi:putative DNA-directed RNA polymerase subunit beta [Pseudomonas phage PA1C]|nr:putative DNA-directed RNA polymerase subunit beta [Pseudomonas phage PA1C]